MLRSSGFAVALLTLAGSPAWADWTYLSRPDLNPPKLNITIPATAQVAPGYLFAAPFSGDPEHGHGPLQPAPYIFTNDGDLVWSGFAQYFSIWAVNFQASQYDGNPVVFAFQGKHNAPHGHGHGHIKLLDDSYRPVAEVRAGHHRLIDKHEGQIIDGETALYQIYHPVPRDLSAYGVDEQHQWIVDSQFQGEPLSFFIDLDIKTGNVIFEWNSLDHVPPSHYFHINSVDKDSQGSYLISARDVNSVYTINGTTGEIIWRLGGRNDHTDFKPLDEEAHFSFQHHARFHGIDEKGREIISLYDNSAHGTETDDGREVHDAPTSSGKILALSTSGPRSTWTVETVQAFYPPDDLLSKSQGSTQVLPNGNVLVNWGSEGAVTEFTPDAKPIFHAYFDSGKIGEGVQNYRAFRFEWKGHPWEEPAVVGLSYPKTGRGAKEHDGKLVLASSWNGDTEVRTWRFYGARRRGGPLELLGEAARTGFETRLELAGQADEWGEVAAKGVDEHGTVIGESRRERVETDRPRPPNEETPEATSPLAFIVQPALKRYGRWR